MRSQVTRPTMPAGHEVRRRNDWVGDPVHFQDGTENQSQCGKRHLEVDSVRLLKSNHQPGTRSRQDSSLMTVVR